MCDLNTPQTNVWKVLFGNEGGHSLINSPYDELALWGGYGSGKTMLLLLIFHLLCLEYGNINSVLIRETYTQLDDTVIFDFNKMFGHIGYKHKEARKEIHYQNGSILRFRAFDQSEKILGGNIDLVAVSQAEQIPHDLFSELFGRQRGKSTLPKKLLITEGNPSECWAKERYADRSKLLPNIFYQHFTTFDNKEFLEKESPGYIARLIQNLPEQQIQKKLYGNWDSHEEMVFSGFSEPIIVIDPFTIPERYKKAVGGDYGYRTPSAFAYGCRDYDGNIIIFDEFYAPEQSMDSLARESKRHGPIPVAYDFSTKRPDRDGKSVWTELCDLGCLLVESNKDELRNIAVVNTLMKQGKLFITRNCVNLIREIKAYRWKKIRLGSESSTREEPVDKDNHAIDAMLYLIAFLEDLTSSPVPIVDITKTIGYHVRKKNRQGWIQNG